MGIPFYEQGWFKYFKNFIIGVGAAVVLVGALAKILYHPLADLMLKVGMLVEAGIFVILGLLPPHKDYHWEKIYPGLDKPADHKELKKLAAAGVAGTGGGSGGNGVSQQLDKILEDSNVDSDLISRLGDNLANLSSNIEKMSDVTDAAGATGDYTTSATAAAGALKEMQAAYSGASEAMHALSDAQGDTVKYHEQVQLVSKNLEQLNAIYELELQDTNNHLKAMNKFYGGLTDAMSSLDASIDDTRTYQEQMSVLARNLGELNGVYGNMLSAMRTPQG